MARKTTRSVIDKLLTARLYPFDHHLLTQLLPKATLPKTLPYGERVDLGTHTLAHSRGEDEQAIATIHISVIGMPAQFWSFSIEPVNSDCVPCVIRTGSGSLSHYWPSVVMVAEGMFAVYPEGR